MALPGVTEISHFRFHVPVFKVRGRTFLGMGQDETTAVFCISEPRAAEAVIAHSWAGQAVRRRDARKSFHGLEVQLSGLPGERIRELVAAA